MLLVLAQSDALTMTEQVGMQFDDVYTLVACVSIAVQYAVGHVTPLN